MRAKISKGNVLWIEVYVQSIECTFLCLLL